MDQTEAELEHFRKQWREEVSAKSKTKEAAEQPIWVTKTIQRTAESNSRLGVPIERFAVQDDGPSRTYHDVEEKEQGRKLGDHTAESSAASSSKEPISALEHYEHAVEKETQGNLGESVSFYRKAFKLDARVHEKYKNKHFPPSSFPTPTPKTPHPNPSNAPVTVPNTAHHSLHGLPLTLSDLISDFSALSIAREPPPTELSPAPPCPVASIPEELLVDILQHIAIQDVAAFTRLALVCKRLAYLVMTEDQIWKRIACGREFGFAGMQYSYACDVIGVPVSSDLLSDDSADGYLISLDPDHIMIPSPVNLNLSPAYPTHQAMFRHRPRLRYNGVYISTVNYTRPGAASANTLTWNTPVLIVTYYRYLRFYRDGSVISLLTTSEPSEVVHNLQKENLPRLPGAEVPRTKRGQDSAPPPPAVMKDALRGRWHLGSPTEAEILDSSTLDQDESHLQIETLGVVPRYLYKLSLLVSSAGHGKSNNKLAWRGYWSYNRLTDDWSEFGLKNDRAFWFSRVRRFGVGMGAG